jgi:hypothetical protein
VEYLHRFGDESDVRARKYRTGAAGDFNPLARAGNDNDTLSADFAERIIYAGHPYANPVRGTLETIRSFFG